MLINIELQQVYDGISFTQYRVYLNGRLLGFWCKHKDPKKYTVTPASYPWIYAIFDTQELALDYLINEANKAHIPDEIHTNSHEYTASAIHISSSINIAQAIPAGTTGSYSGVS